MSQCCEWVVKAEMHTESNGVWILDYYLLTFFTEAEAENEGEIGENDAPVRFYGLRVDKSTPDGTVHESEETPAITESHEAALALIHAFAKGSVPPVTLIEMADEWLPQAEATASASPLRDCQKSAVAV